MQLPTNMSETPHCIGTPSMPPLLWYRRCIQGKPHLFFIQVQHGLRYHDFRLVNFRSLFESEQRHKISFDLGKYLFRYA